MAAFIVQASSDSDRNSDGVNAVIVDAASSGDALTAALPLGAKSTWTATAYASPVRVEGLAIVGAYRGRGH